MLNLYCLCKYPQLLAPDIPYQINLCEKTVFQIVEGSKGSKPGINSVVVSDCSQGNMPQYYFRLHKCCAIVMYVHTHLWRPRRGPLACQYSPAKPCDNAHPV